MLIRAVVYFGLVFGAGFLLGPIRVFWLTPRVGERFAELLEAPVMLVVIVFAARWLVRRFPASSRVSDLGSGILALLLVLGAELSVVLGIRKISVSEYIFQRDPVAGWVYLCLLLVFAVMPCVLARAVGPRPAA